MVKDGRANPRALRQVSAGSIAGMWDFLCGMCVGGSGGWSRRREWERMFEWDEGW